MLTGVWNTIFGYLIFLLLYTVLAQVFHRRYMAYMSAMMAGQILAVISAFLLHKYFTFRSAAAGWLAWREFFRFSFTYALSFVISIIALPILVEMIELNPKIAAGIITIVLATAGYLIHSRFTFKNSSIT